MKKYDYFYLTDSGDFHVVFVESDCTPNAARKAREIALPHNRKLSFCAPHDEGYSLSGVRDSLMSDKRTLERCGRLPSDMD